MDFEIRPLKLDYNALSTYATGVRQKIIENGIDDQEGPPYNMNYTKYQFKMGEKKPELALGAYDGEKLVGTIMAIIYDVIINDFQQDLVNIDLKAAYIGNIGIAADYWPGFEIKMSLISEILKKIESMNIDFVLTTPLQDKSPDLIDHLKEIGFKVVNKNVECNVKLMGKDAIDVLKVAQGLNPIEAAGAKLFASWKSDGIEEGTIRDVTTGDYPKIVELLNAYINDLTLSIKWDEEELKGIVDRIKQLDNPDLIEVNKKFPDSAYGSHMKVWEINGEVKAHAIYAVVEVHMTHEYVPLIFFENSSFAQDLRNEQKRDFISAILREHEHKVIVSDLTIPYFDKKAFDKAGFMGDHRTRRFLIKSLTDKSKNNLDKINKIKKFYILTLDFTI